jgi:ABC-type transporter lipoprotein component MlaA
MINRQLGENNVLHVRIFILSLLIAVMSVGTGCASKGNTAKNPDPFEPINRGIFKFNDVADTYLLRPVAKGYQKITPDPVEQSISNAFDTWTYPVTIVNDFLQGKFKQGASDTGRFVVNLTIGLLGLFDPATRLDWNTIRKTSARPSANGVFLPDLTSSCRCSGRAQSAAASAPSQMCR